MSVTFNPYQKAARFLFSVLAPLPNEESLEKAALLCWNVKYLVCVKRNRNDVGVQWMEGFVETELPVDVTTVRRYLKTPHMMVEIFEETGLQKAHHAIEELKARAFGGKIIEYGYPQVDNSTDDEVEFGF